MVEITNELLPSVMFIFGTLLGLVLGVEMALVLIRKEKK